MPELALDQWQRDTLVQQLDSVRVAELVGSEAPPEFRARARWVDVEDWHRLDRDYPRWLS